MQIYVVVAIYNISLTERASVCVCSFLVLQFRLMSQKVSKIRQKKFGHVQNWELIDITSVSYWRAGNWCHYGVINAISWWFWDVKRKMCIMSKTNKIWIITLVAYTRFVFNRGINANKFKKITGCTLNSGVQHHNSFVSLLVFIALQGYIRRGSTTTHNQISHAWFSRKYTIQSCTI